MKYCPECDADFPESDQFCEFDGTSLVSDEPEAELKPDSDAELKPESNWKMVAIAIGGVVIGVILFLSYHAFTREPVQQSSDTRSSNSSVAVQQQASMVPLAPSPVASASPSVEPSPSPSATPMPSPKIDHRIGLSSTAISTDANQETKRGPVIIRLSDGAKIESDEAWQTREGIWYRRGSVIALLDPKQVNTIEKKVAPATAAPSPAESSAPGSSQSPASGTSQSPAPGTSQSAAPDTSQSAAPDTSQSAAPDTSQKPAPIKTASQNSSRILTPPRRHR